MRCSESVTTGQSQCPGAYASAMFKKLTSPYRHAPAIISTARIDAALAQGAQAEFQSSGRRGYKAVDLVTFAVDGRIVDQFPVSGHVASTAKFVAAYNRKLAAMR
jgi:hypothetical protein